MDHRRDAVTDALDAESDLFARFSARLTTAGGIAHRAEGIEDAAETIAAMHPGAWASSRLVDRQPALVGALERRGCVVRVPDDPAAVRDQPLGLTLATIAIAETGSVLLDEREIVDRSVSLMTNVLVVVCPIDALRASLDDAAPALRDISRPSGSYATLVTGPSRTADIERQLTVGVQGPGEIHVVFVPGSDEGIQ